MHFFTSEGKIIVGALHIGYEKCRKLFISAVKKQNKKIRDSPSGAEPTYNDRGKRGIVGNWDAAPSGLNLLKFKERETQGVGDAAPPGLNILKKKKPGKVAPAGLNLPKMMEGKGGL